MCGRPAKAERLNREQNRPWSRAQAGLAQADFSQ
jgi:hypothetical protein